MRIINFCAGMTIKYKSHKWYEFHAIYDSNSPNNPLWFTGSICEILNVKEDRLTSQSLAKKYKRKVLAIDKEKKYVAFNCITTQGLLYLINKRAKTREIENFLNWLKSTALPEIKQQGDKIINENVIVPANKEVNQIEVSATPIDKPDSLLNTTVPVVNTTTTGSNSEITFSNQQEQLIKIILEKEHLIQENLYLKSQLEDYSQRLYETELRLDEVLRSNNQLSELANKIIG